MMSPINNRNRNRPIEINGLGKAPTLLSVLEFLHTKYKFPVANPARPADGKRLREPYVQKLESLLEYDPSRVHKVLRFLDIAVRGPGPSRQNKGHVQKLVTGFDEALGNELSQVRDMQEDRDLSILPFFGMEAVNGKAGGIQRFVAAEIDGEEKEAGFGYDGRFDDPLTEYPSPASRVSPQTRSKIDTPPTSRILSYVSKNKSSLLPDNEEPIHSDPDDSDQSFHSCPATPPRPELTSQKAEPGIAYFLPTPPNNRSTMRTPQGPRRGAYRTSRGRAQQTPSPRQSTFAGRGKRPFVPMPSVKPEARTLRNFHSIRQRSIAENPMQASFGTDTTRSDESSFNASSSPSNKTENGSSPPTSADTSFEEAGPRDRLIRQKGSRVARLAIVTEAVDETRVSRQKEAPYNADWDGESTDIDDTEITCGDRQSRAPAQGSKKVISSINTPPKKLPLLRNGKRVSATPKLNGRKEEQSQTEKRATEGQEEREGEEEEEEEEMFRRLAKTFFGGNLESDSPPHGDMLANSDSETRCVSQQEHCLDESEDEVQPDAGPKEVGEESPTNILDNKLEPAKEVREPSDDDDDDEFGAIDASFENELSQHPALNPTAHPLPTLHFSVQHEATRVALNEGFPPEVICTHLHGYCDDLYQAKERCDMWETLTRFSKAAATLEWTGESVWGNFKAGRGWPDNVSLSGRVHCGESQQPQGSPIKGAGSPVRENDSEKIPLVITLNPLRRAIGNRFFNRFGSDRFLTLRLPSLSSLPGLPEDVVQQRRKRIIDWLADEEVNLINRTWKCFYLKDGSSKKKSEVDNSKVTEYFTQAIFFATKGVGIGDNLSNEEMEALGFGSSEKKLRQEMSVEELLKWHIPLDGNLDMTVPKFWSRISLGFSDATPTITFEHSQIQFVGDKKSPTGEVMNDGCSVASPAVMKMVRQKLGLDATPTAVQARVSGAKGVWMVDPNSNWDDQAVWIKVTESQLKYKGFENDDDWARVTLDVLSVSHDPHPAKINIQLIPILEDRGVPFSVLQELLEEHLERDLEELFQIMNKPVELRRWVYDQGHIGSDRRHANCIAMLGALPASKHEAAIMLLESGFLVNECKFLTKLVLLFINQHCDDLKTKLHVEIPHSTTLLCVADPTETLEEGEVSLRFSKGVLDPNTMRRNPIIIGDILVARNPAQLPSDIQRVKAIDSPQLRELQDVIVFSVKGDRSLASLLSGGDYDGDKPWVCWDQRVVEHFENSPTAYDEFEEKARSYFDKSGTKMVDLLPHQQGFFNRFFRAGIFNSLQDNFLGYCTSVWEKYCYDSQNKISDDTAIKLAKLCSFLVDAPKQGLSILPQKRVEITTLGRKYQKPAYRDTGSPEKCVHVIDRLKFDVTETKVTEKLTTFHDNFGANPNSYEPLITEAYHREDKLAGKEKSGESVALVLRHLSRELQSLRDDWRNWRIGAGGGVDDFNSGVPRFYRRFRAIKPPEEYSKDPVISRWVSEGNSPFSHWNILRASTAYNRWSGNKGLVWYMACRELCFMKSHGVQTMGSDIGPRSIIEEMYAPLRPSKKLRGTKEAIVEDQDDETLPKLCKFSRHIPTIHVSNFVSGRKERISPEISNH